MRSLSLLLVSLFWILLAFVIVPIDASLAPTTETPVYSNETNFGLMFDAGSSGTRLFIYQWYPGKIPSVWNAPVYHDFNESDWTARITPGISSFAGEKIPELDAYFTYFLDYALSKIPARYHHRTYVFLYATAGMRLLPESDQTAILSKIRTIFSNWPFRFLKPKKWAKIISGVDEGVYGWITTNYLTHRFQLNDPMATFGALDLGGASTQITFVPSYPVPPSYGGTRVKLGDTYYDLYSYSYLGHGLDQARKETGKILGEYCEKTQCQHLIDYCNPTGYNTQIPFNNSFIETFGGGHFEKCQTETAPVLNASQCANCRIGNVFQPPLRGKFYAMSAFVYPLLVWGIPLEGTSLEQIEDAARSFCELDWKVIQEKYPAVEPKLLSNYCFLATYETQLLSRYGFRKKDKNAIIYAQEIGPNALSWTLGAMVTAAEQVDSMNS